jgi:hypothetical protein
MKVEGFHDFTFENLENLKRSNHERIERWKGRGRKEEGGKEDTCGSSLDWWLSRPIKNKRAMVKGVKGWEPLRIMAR